MKKFFVGLLSIFMLFGASLLAACGGGTPQLNVYYNGKAIEKVIEIELNPQDQDSGYILLSADMTGVSDPTITASPVGGSEEIFESIEPAGRSNGKDYFKVVAKRETTNGPAAVRFFGEPGGVEQFVYINVYSNVTSMTQNAYEARNQFLVNGHTYTVDKNGIVNSINAMTENQLIEFKPSQNSRRNLSWEIQKADKSDYTAIASGSTFTVDSNVIQTEPTGDKVVVLRATDTINNAQTTITLTVLEEIAGEVEMLWNRDSSSYADAVKPGADYQEIISNISTDDNYQGYSWVKYAGDELQIVPVAYVKTVEGTEVKWHELYSDKVDRSGISSDLYLENHLRVLSIPGDATYSGFSVSTASATNVKEYKLTFRVGYKQYNYYGKTNEVFLDLKEKVNRVYVSTRDNYEMEGNLEAKTTIDIYNSYTTIKGVSKKEYGQIFKVSLIPDAENGAQQFYNVSFKMPDIAYANPEKCEVCGRDDIAFACPFHLYYMAPNGAVRMLETAIDTTTPNDIWYSKNPISENGELYIIASSQIAGQSIDGVIVNFVSVDNDKASTSFKVNLKKSAAQENFDLMQELLMNADGTLAQDTDPTSPTYGEYIEVANTGFVRIDSSKVAEKYTKAFRLGGQSNVDGLYLDYINEDITIDSIKMIESNPDENYVIFTVDFALNARAYGKTVQVVYSINHENGAKTVSDTAPGNEKYVVNIALPFVGYSIYPDMGANLSNSITDVAYNASDVSLLMLKNATLTPLLLSMASTNGYVPKIDEDKTTVEYYDFTGTTEAELNAFLKLNKVTNYLGDEVYASYEEFVANVAGLVGSTDSNVAYLDTGKISKDLTASISTKNAGYTYIVLTLYGTDLEGNEKAISKVILVESYVAPEGLTIKPAADRELALTASDSVSSEYENLTYRDINIVFDNSNVTYSDTEKYKDLLVISSKHFATNNEYQKYYSIEGVSLTKTGITFKITALSTDGKTQVSDVIDLVYQIKKDGRVVYKAETSIVLTITNAQRIESVSWKNYDAQGLYYEIGSSETNRLVLLETTPTNAKDDSMYCLVTDSVGNKRTDVFTGASYDEVATGMFSFNLSDIFKGENAKGMSGKIYIIPQDAVNGGVLKYYYMTDANGNKIPLANIEDASTKNESVVQVLSAVDIGKNYENLATYGYFKSTTEEGTKIVSLADIILSIDLEVADGSEEHPFRVFTADHLIGMQSNLHYLVMNDIDLTGESYSAKDITGGVKGFNQDGTTTITLDKLLFNTIAKDAYIKNLTFIGNVSGHGFVANENNGTIDGVTIDTNGLNPSRLTGSGDVGGLVGNNTGTITNSAVLGLNITGTTVGGIVGANSGEITNSRVEFYNLAAPAPTNATTNKFTGTSVGGIVGKMTGGKIYRTYVYDYTLTASNQSSNLNGLDDPISATTPTAGIIDYVFAVTGLNTTTATFASNNYYLGYYDGTTYKINNTNTLNNSNFANPTFENGEENPEFDASINNGQPYFKDFYQPKALSASEIASVEVKDYAENNFYKSINVSADSGLVFFYQLTIDETTLSSSEQIDYTQMNTIALADMFGFNKSIKSVIVTSSNNRVVRPMGSSLLILSTGEVTITITSKQDVTVNKTISIKVVNPLTNLVLSRVGQDGKAIEINNGSVLAIQKTTSKDVYVAQRTTSVYLGALASLYNLVQPQWQISTSTEAVIGTLDENKKVSVVKSSAFITLVTTEETSTAVGTKVSVYPAMTGVTAAEQIALTRVFTKQFIAQASDGVIFFEISGEELPLSPSTKAVVKTRVETTFEDETIAPVVVYNGRAMEVESSGSGFIFKDVFGNKVLFATIGEKEVVKNNNPYVYVYEVTFSVHSEYQRKVADDMIFNVYFTSASGNSSLAWGGNFDLVLSRQGFTNVDTSFVKIDRTYISDQKEVFETNKQVSTLAPGNAAILKVTVNPEFAYYDYAKISFSGANVANPVVLDAVEERTDGKFQTLSETIATTEREGTSLRYYPKDKSHRIFFKVWINTTVERDTTMKFTVAFYKNGQSEPLDYVNSYLDISYLSEPKVTINGEEIAFIAKGTTNEVKIQVKEDQSVDSIALDGDFGLDGVSLSTLSAPTIDAATGIKTYVATLRCFVNAKSDTKNRFYIKASVSRTLNGETESKQTTATAVIVDFKIDDIAIENANDSQFLAWQNISKRFNITYDLLPEVYSTGEASQEKIDELVASKEFFRNNHYYPASVSATDPNAPEYYINWLQDKDTKAWSRQSVLDRLYVRSGGTDIHWENVDLPFSFTEDKNTGIVQIKGSSINTPPVTMVLYTYVYAGGVQTVIETEFVVSVVAFSDPDLPLSIKSASDFLKLDPSRKQEGAVEGEASNRTPQDYILENDIVLENYTPFSTNLIRSLDGNGYTIYLKSFDLETQKDLKLALFDDVSDSLPISEVNSASQTTLKNLRVNYYNGGQITVDISRHSSVNVAGIAITNNGIITNCEVVSFYETALVGETITDIEPVLPSIQHSKPQGFNIAYRNGENTTEDASLADNSRWSTSVAGFVLTNNGSITNSRVGGDEVIMIDSVGVQDGIQTFAHTQTLGKFSIIAQGNIAGFVGTNNGNIASSFAKNIEIKNSSAATKYWTAGFVGVNNDDAAVITSYAEGVKSPDTTNSAYLYANIGSTISSNMGFISGFTYENKGEIKDSYSNILIANSTTTDRVYLASGFVYTNEGMLENCYSAAQVANANYSQMNFSGVNTNGQLLANGTYENCYFYSAELFVEEKEDVYDDTAESQYKTGAKLIANPSIESSFYGFAIAETEQFFKDGIWSCSVEEGIRLIEPDYIAKSHRYKVYLPSKDDGDSEEYVLPYATLMVDGNTPYDTSLGGKNNPILIADAEDWQEISGTSLSSYVQMTFNENEIFGIYRVVNDIDFSVLKEELISTYKNFTGALYGNGFQLSNISLSQTNEEILENGTLSFGLFSTMSGPIVDKLKTDKPTLVMNVDMQINQVTAGLAPSVGGLAGVARGATLINIEVQFGEENSVIEGLNFAGGLVGFAYGENKIKNIIVKNPNVIADTFTEGEKINYIQNLSSFRNSARNNLATTLTGTAKDYSYAGSVIGYIDNYKSNEQSDTSFSSETKDAEVIYDINFIRVEGTVQVKAQVVGGVFGLSGYNTKVNDAVVTISVEEGKNSRLISTRYFAGGLVGQAYGRFSRVYTVHEDTTQKEIEDNMGSYYSSNNKSAQRGVLDLFDTTNIDLDNKQIAVGGLFGYVGSGLLEISYSKLNVTSMSSQYAGGLIGMMDVANAETYTATADALYNVNEETRYFINEVFATGDVRSSVMAGGLIGVIKGSNSKIKVLAANAVNYITTYDYATGGEVPIDPNQFEISSTLKVNSFVGRFINVDKDTGIESIETFESRGTKTKEQDNTVQFSISGNKLNNYIEFCKATDAVLNTGDALPSTARFRYYMFGTDENAQKLYLKRFGEPFATDTAYTDPSVTEEDNHPDMNDSINSQGYAIYYNYAEDLTDEAHYIKQAENPSYFVDSASGKSYTQAVFLNSGVWNYDNWAHPIDSLFPEIRSSETLDMSYLDLYNAAQVFEHMNNAGNGSTVIVRGLEQANMDVEDPASFSHIEIAKSTVTGMYYIANNGLGDVEKNQFHAIGSLREFTGRIIGGRYPESSLVKTQIISNTNFISQLGEGATIIDQEFVFGDLPDAHIDVGEIAVSANYDGLEEGVGVLVKKALTKVTLTNVVLTFKEQVVITGHEFGNSEPTGYEQNFGLVAPVISSCNIENLTINNAIADSSKSLMTVEELTQACSGSTLIKIPDETKDPKSKPEDIEIEPYINIGTIAGKLINISADEAMVVKGFTINKKSTSNTLISINGQASAKNVNIGGYFGKITKSFEGSAYFVGEFAAPSWQGEYTRIFVGDNVGEQNLNIGGFVGHLQSCESLSTPESKSLTSKFAYGLVGTYNVLNVGNVIGLHQNTSNVILQGSINDSADIRMVLASTASWADDGFALDDEDSNTNENFKTKYAENRVKAAMGAIGGIIGKQEQLTTLNNFANIDMKVSVQSTDDSHKIAGYVAWSRADLQIENIKKSVVTGFVNLNGDNKDTNHFVSSVVGYTDKTAKKLVFNSELLSTLNVDLVNVNGEPSTPGDNTGDTNFGSVLGALWNDDGANGSQVLINQGSTDKMVAYNGTINVYGQHAQLRIGGVVGGFRYNTPAAENKLIINGKNSFGGKLVITKAKTLHFGGSVGVIRPTNTTAATFKTEVSLVRSYNYGDVFVDYSSTFTALDAYYFGGLIGEAGIAKYYVRNNYSAVTSHNARYLQSTNTAHALIGSGEPTTDGQDYNTANGYKNTINYTDDSVSGGHFWNNLYSHAVCLLNDSIYNGRDIGYNTGYTEQVRRGYERGGNDDLNCDIIQRMLYGLGVYKALNSIINADNFGGSGTNAIGNPFPVGHKLNPVVINEDISSTKTLGTYYIESQGKIGEHHKDNAMSAYIPGSTTMTYNDKLDSLVGVGAYNFTDDLVYYTLGQDITVTADSSGSGAFVYSQPSALIGDAYQINFNNTNDEVGALINDTASGFSFISSLVEKIDVKLETKSTSKKTIAGLIVYSNEDTQLYAINVYGNMDIGGTKQAFVAALAMEFGGKISDCSTDVDIVGRLINPTCTTPGHSHNVWCSNSQLIAFADTRVGTGDCRPMIECCYSMGSVQTLAGNKIWAFVQRGDNKTKIEECYSATRIDYRNYIDVSDETVKVSTSGDSNANVYLNSTDVNTGAQPESVAFDLDSINIKSSDIASKYKTFTYSTKTQFTGAANSSKWASVSGWYNYCYPTLKYQYLKGATWATQTQEVCDCGTKHTGSTKCNPETYDCYVDNYSYTRAKNGSATPTASSVFILIPNASTLRWRLNDNSSQVNTGLSHNYVFKYDMDLEKTKEFSTNKTIIAGETSSHTNLAGVITFTGKLDGQGHTIKGLTTNLFDKITGGAYIKNLRLTKVDIDKHTSTHNSERRFYGILANEIIDATISNITLSGDIKIDFDSSLTTDKIDEPAIGSLAGKYAGTSAYYLSNIQSSVNMAIDCLDKVKWVDVGGILGKIEGGGNLYYSSNYGNISLYGHTKEKDHTVGGIAGFADNATIKYSYNAAALWNGYDNGNKLINGIGSGYTLKGEFYTGGIIGTASGTTVIDGCYNTGMIKSGNKTSSTNDDVKSYAGGIVARKYSNTTSLTIKNCYNEGSVEALAMNGTYKETVAKCADSAPTDADWFKPLSDANSTGSYYLVIYQDSPQNAWAYGIGPNAGPTNTYKVRQDETGRTSVFANGAGLTQFTDNTGTIQEISKSSIVMTLSVASSSNWAYSYGYNQKSFIWTATDLDNRDERAITRIQMSYAPYSGTINANSSATYVKNDNSNKNYATVPYSITNASTNFIGLPTAIQYSYNYMLTIKLDWRQKEKGCFDGVPDLNFDQSTSSINRWNSDTNMATTIMKEQFVKGINDLSSDGLAGANNIINEYFWRTVLNSTDQTCKMILNNFNTNSVNYSDYSDGKLATSVPESVLTNTRSAKTYLPEESYNQLNIAGHEFFLAKDNSISIFQSGLKTSTLNKTVNVKGTDIYSYKLTGVYKGGTLGSTNAVIGYSDAVITDNKNGTVTVTANLFSSEDVTPSSVDFSLSVDYNKEEQVTLTGLSLTYIGGSLYSIASSSVTDFYKDYWDSRVIDGKTYYSATLSKTGTEDKTVYLYYDSGFKFDNTIESNNSVSLQDLVGGSLKFNTTTTMLTKRDGYMSFSALQEYTGTLDLEKTRILGVTTDLSYQGYLTETEKQTIMSLGTDVVFTDSSNSGEGVYKDGSFTGITFGALSAKYYRDNASALEEVELTGDINVDGTGPYEMASALPDHVKNYIIKSSSGDDITAFYTLSGTTITLKEGETADAPSKVEYELDETKFIQAYRITNSISKYHYGNGAVSATSQNQTFTVNLSSGKTVELTGKPLSIDNSTNVKYGTDATITLTETYSDTWLIEETKLSEIPKIGGDSVVWVAAVEKAEQNICYDTDTYDVAYNVIDGNEFAIVYLPTHILTPTVEDGTNYSIVLGTGKNETLLGAGTVFKAQEDETQHILTNEGIWYLYSKEAGDKPSDSTQVTFVNSAKINGVEYNEGSTVAFSTIKGYLATCGETVELEYGSVKTYTYTETENKWTGDSPEYGAKVTVKSGTVIQKANGKSVSANQSFIYAGRSSLEWTEDTVLEWKNYYNVYPTLTRNTPSRKISYTEAGGNKVIFVPYDLKDKDICDMSSDEKEVTQIAKQVPPAANNVTISINGSVTYNASISTGCSYVDRSISVYARKTNGTAASTPSDLYEVSGQTVAFFAKNGTSGMDSTKAIVKFRERGETQSKNNAITFQASSIAGRDIILTEDISFKDKISASTQMNYNIIGNDYNISYYGSKTLLVGIKAGKTIKNVHILGEVGVFEESVDYLFNSTSEETGLIKNSSLYGTMQLPVNEYSAYTNAGDNYRPGVLMWAMSVQTENIQAYVSIDATHHLKNVELLATPNKFETNCKVVAARGIDNYIGRNGGSLIHTKTTGYTSLCQIGETQGFVIKEHISDTTSLSTGGTGGFRSSVNKLPAEKWSDSTNYVNQQAEASTSSGMGTGSVIVSSRYGFSINAPKNKTSDADIAYNDEGKTSNTLNDVVGNWEPYNYGMSGSNLVKKCYWRGSADENGDAGDYLVGNLIVRLAHVGKNNERTKDPTLNRVSYVFISGSDKRNGYQTTFATPARGWTNNVFNNYKVD